METKTEETNCKNLLRKKLSKEELTEKIWEENKKFCLKKIPLAFHGSTYEELEEEGKGNLTEKIRNWDMKKTFVCAILSHQNGIGKTHLAAVYVKDLYKRKIKALEGINYAVYEKRYKILSESEEEISEESFESELFAVYPINVSLPRYATDYHQDFIFVQERELLNEYKKCTDYKNDMNEEDFFKKYENTELLVIDDAFSTNENNPELSRSIIFPILDKRINYTEKPTIITSNLMINEIANISTGIASRINNSMLIAISSKMEDQRQRG